MLLRLPLNNPHSQMVPFARRARKWFPPARACIQSRFGPTCSGSEAGPDPGTEVIPQRHIAPSGRINTAPPYIGKTRVGPLLGPMPITIAGGEVWGFLK